MVQWLRLQTPNAEAPSSMPALGTRPHRPQLRVGMPQLKMPWRSCMLHAAPETQRSQINFLFYFIFKLYNIVLVLPYIKMNPPQAYMCSPSWTLLPRPSPYHPSGSSQCTSSKHPVSFIEPGLATHFIYDIIQVLMPFSQIIPPSPSPTESKRLFYTSVSLLLSRIQGYCYHLSEFHIYALVYCIGVFFFRLTSLCIIGSSFIHLIRTDSNVFFLIILFVGPFST